MGDAPFVFKIHCLTDISPTVGIKSLKIRYNWCFVLFFIKAYGGNILVIWHKNDMPTKEGTIRFESN